ncbi:MAG: hypothetical protein KME21_09815 [Desmonostoc vinosum HA7617-LM4]|jgi:hypothetical protein|nr:hypothetical protein [Desmonostoc vinosum HA7617-LM4]
MKNSTILVGNILIIAAIALCVLPFVRPQLFKRQDILVIAAFLIAGINLLLNGKYLDDLPQFSLIILAASAVFYTAETMRLRMKDHRKQ